MAPRLPPTPSNQAASPHFPASKAKRKRDVTPRSIYSSAVDRAKSQLARLLEFDRRVRARQYPNCHSFANKWEVSVKTIQRDVDFLRDQLGAPLQYDREHRGYTYTDANWFLPYVSLSRGELLWILVASQAAQPFRGIPMARELRRLFGKLSHYIPGRQEWSEESILNHFTFTTPPSHPVDSKIWVALVQGMLNHNVLGLDYRSFRSTRVETLRVEPYHVANLQGEWYLLARVPELNEIRQFAMARVSRVETSGPSFTPDPAFDPSRFLDKTFGRAAIGSRMWPVRLRFSARVSAWVAEQTWHPGQKIRRRRSGEVDLSFDAPGMVEVFRWVLAWGSDVRVLAPAELQRMVRDEVRAMQACGDGT